MKKIIFGSAGIWLIFAVNGLAAPDPRDSVILESKVVRATSGTKSDVRLRVWITNKDTLTNVSLALEERSLSNNAYLTLAQPRTFAGTVDRLTTTLGNYLTSVFTKYDGVSPDSFSLAGFYDPQDAARSAEPPNSIRKPIWDIKFDTVASDVSGGLVQFDSSRLFSISTQFVNMDPQDVRVNFVKGLVTVTRHFPDLPLDFPPNGAFLLSRRPVFRWQSARDSLLAKINADYAVLVARDTFFSPAFRSERLTDTVWKITDTLLMRHQYFWKVAALPDSGDTIFSETRSFTVVNPPIALWRPLPSQVLTIRQPSFAWQKVADSSTGDTFSYRVLLSANAGFAAADSSPLLTDTVWKADHKLQIGKIFHWKVIALGGNRDTAYSNNDSFVVQSPPLALFRPLSNQTLQIRQPTFAWQKVADTSTGEPFAYRVLLSTDINFATPDSSPLLTDTVWKADHKLQAGQTYHWKVLALTNGGDTVSSLSRGFDVENPVLTLLRPLQNQVLRIRQPSFIWQNVGDTSTGDLFSYRLLLSKDTGFTAPGSSPILTDTVWKGPGALDLFQTYYWKILAADTIGDTVASAGRGKFFVTPPLLSLLVPVNGSRELVKQPVLRWSALRDTSMENSFSYQVAMATRSDFGEAVFSSVLGDTFWSPGSALEVGTTYYWYVTGFYSATGDTVWSSGPFSFSVSPTRIVVPSDRPTVQDAIDVALNGDTVWVTPGIYIQNIQFKGKRIKVLSEGGPPVTFIVKQLDGLPLVTFAGNEDSSAVLGGFTLSGARQISNGGAIKIVRASPRIENNYILGNSGDAGAVWIEGGAPKLRRNLLAGNGGRAAIRLLSGATGEITNCTVADNVGDGVLVDSNLAVRITNCILSFNTGYGIRSAVTPNFSPIVTYNDFYGNTTGDFSGITPGAGNLFLDPQFLNRDSLDYRIRGTSPCRDAGNPSSAVPPGGGSRVDMGAFEFVGLRGDLDGDGILELADAILELNCVFAESNNCSLNLNDFDCNGRLSATDVVWMLNAVFAAVPLPC